MSSSVDFMLGKLVQISVRVLPSCGVWDQPWVFCYVSSFIILDDISWFLENLFCHDNIVLTMSIFLVALPVVCYQLLLLRHVYISGEKDCKIWGGFFTSVSESSCWGCDVCYLFTSNWCTHNWIPHQLLFIHTILLLAFQPRQPTFMKRCEALFCSKSKCKESINIGCLLVSFVYFEANSMHIGNEVWNPRYFWGFL